MAYEAAPRLHTALFLDYNFASFHLLRLGEAYSPHFPPFRKAGKLGSPEAIKCNGLIKFIGKVEPNKLRVHCWTGTGGSPAETNQDLCMRAPLSITGLPWVHDIVLHRDVPH